MGLLTYVNHGNASACGRGLGSTSGRSQPPRAGRSEACSEARRTTVQHYYVLFQKGLRKVVTTVPDVLPKALPHALAFAWLTCVRQVKTDLIVHAQTQLLKLQVR